MVLCFKLYFIKDATICTTAAATVRQMVSVIFERVVTEDSKGLGKFCSWSILRNNILVAFRLLFFLKVKCSFSYKGENVHQQYRPKMGVKTFTAVQLKILQYGALMNNSWEQFMRAPYCQIFIRNPVVILLFPCLLQVHKESIVLRF